MATEVNADDIVSADVPPIVDPPQRSAKEREEKREQRREQRREERDERREEKRERRAAASPFREIEKDQLAQIREMIHGLGGTASYRCSVRRLSPDTAPDPQTGELVKVKGHLETLENEHIDEEVIKQRWGGGKYELTFTVKDAKGSFVYLHGGHAVVEIAGDPLMTSLPRLHRGPQGEPGRPAESSSVAQEALKQMASTNERLFEMATKPAAPVATGLDPATQAVVSMLQATNDRLMNEMSDMRKELALARQPLPVVARNDDDKPSFQSRLLEKFVDGDSARVESLRTQFESERRALVQSAIDLERRLRDEFDRDRKQLESRHDMMMQMLKTGYEQQLANARAASEQALAAIKSAGDTQNQLLNADIKRLERDNSELRTEVKDLRAKKEKSSIELAKEYDQLREVFGGGDDEPKGAIATIAEAISNPDTIAAAAQIFQRPEPPPQQQQLQQPPPTQVFRHADGSYWKAVDGQLVPVKRQKKKKPKRPPAPQAANDQVPTDGAEADAAPAQPGEQPEPQPAEEAEAAPEQEYEDELPELEDEQRTVLIGLLENSVGRQDPAIVAQMLRPRIPENAMNWLGDKYAELGVAKTVNMFLAQVAQVPAGSVLLTQDGRNWMRQLTRELLGDTQ